MTLRDQALELHRVNRGKLEVSSKVPLANGQDLSLAYTPGVAEACLEIVKDPQAVYEYTLKGNLVAVVSDGSAVLGLGNIGPAGALPVMEGKCLLFKGFAGVDAFPICVSAKTTDEIVQMVKWLEPTIGAVNLEDISAPRCFEIERRLKRETDIPIFHDDQHGTAVVVLAALLNALKVVGKRLESARIVVNGAGAAGIATSNLLLDSGAKDVVVCDTKGIVYDGRPEGMNSFKAEVAKKGNIREIKGTLSDALTDADVCVGLSGPNTITREMVSAMGPDSIVIAMANPTPEIYPDEAKAGGAAVVGTGRSDYPNQVNNVLAFPGILRGALDARASDINESMKTAAAKAIAGLISPHELTAEYIIPGPFDLRVGPAVARAVARAALESKVARVRVDPDEVYEKAKASQREK